MVPITCDELLDKVNKNYTHSRLRWGQLLYSELSEVRPDLARAINGTKIDPFYIFEKEDCKVAVACLKLMW